MLITIIAVSLLVIGIILNYISYKMPYSSILYSNRWRIFNSIATAIHIAGILGTVLVLSVLLIVHTFPGLQIKTCEAKQRMLEQRLEINSKNDASLMSEIQEWNEDVNRERLINENIWLNWFVDDAVLESKHTIEIGKIV